MKKIKFKMGLASALVICVVLACVILLNAIVSVISDKVTLSVDLTKDKVYEFSQQTKDVMKALDKEVIANALIPDGSQGEYIDYMREYLDKYKALNKNFKVKYIDPYQDPAFMQKYNDGENQADAGSVIIQCGEEYKIITFNQIYGNGFNNSVQIDMERKVTNAVMNVTGQMLGAKVYFISGHGEAASEYLDAALKEEGYSTGTINLSIDKIPEDADILYCLVPTGDFTADEIDVLDKFMDNGGKLVLSVTPGMKPLERIDSYLDEWGLKLNYDYVIEADSGHAVANGNGLPIPVPTLLEHAITKKLMESDSPLLMPVSMSISLKPSDNSAYAVALLETSDKSYGKTDLASASIEQAEEDIKGPLTLAAISERSGEKPSSVTVIGSTYALEMQDILTEGAYLNGDFVFNLMNYLSGSQSSSIRAKQISAELMTMTEAQINLVSKLLLYVIPALILLLGLVVWFKRRYK